MEVNLREFVRLILLKDQFSKNGGTNSEPEQDYLIKKKGEFIPNDTNDFLLNSIITQIRSLSENLDKLPVNCDSGKSNISPEEHRALKSLRNNRDIVIKKVDNGGGIVIMDTDYYVNIVTECLNNTEVYQKSHPKSF